MTEETFQKRQDTIFNKHKIPEEFRDLFYETAHELNRIYGYEETLNFLEELIFTFNKQRKDGVL